MKKKQKTYKVARGQFEQQRLHEDNVFETQRALMFILPVLMIAILAVGLYFGYQTYRHNTARTAESSAAVTIGEEDTDPMLLQAVFSANTLEPDYVPALKEVEGVKVSAYAAEDLSAMLKAAREDGNELILSEGYISFEEQKEKYNAAVKAYKKSSKASTVKAEAHIKLTIPQEGECEQQTGLLVYLTADTDGEFNKSPVFRWLMRYGADYGFILRYPDSENIGGLQYSPNLFRYVGRDHAYAMRAYNMDFDEYLVYIASH